MTLQLEGEQQPLTLAGRLLMALLGVVLLVVWGIACWLEPDPRGFGTHEGLGLPPCSFKAWTGRPCPSCGMTTAFANMARGRLVAATKANCGGVLVALASLVMAPWCLASARQGRLLGVTAPDRALLALLVPIISISLVNWLIRLILWY